MPNKKAFQWDAYRPLVDRGGGGAQGDVEGCVSGGPGCVHTPPGPGGTPPVNRMTYRCKNITFQ